MSFSKSQPVFSNCKKIVFVRAKIKQLEKGCSKKGVPLHLNCSLLTLKFIWGSSTNDVTVLGGRGYQGFCDNSTKAIVLKRVTMGGGGVKNYPKLRDVIYG